MAKRPFQDKKPSALAKSSKPDIIDLLASDDDDDEEQLFASIPSFQLRKSSGDDSKKDIKPVVAPMAVASSSTAATAATTTASSGMKHHQTKLGSCLFSIVGMAHHGFNPTTVTAGQVVTLEREPKNRHDRNAIKVLTADKKQIGYLSATDAALLAPVMDTMASNVVVTATIHAPGTYSGIAVMIDLYAQANRLLSRFESQPMIRQLQKRLGSRFRLVPKAPPPPVVAVTAKAESTMPKSENVNNVNQQQTADIEQEAAVRSILEASKQGKTKGGGGAYYRILNLPDTCRLPEIKAQYRTLARSVHPDRNNAAQAAQAFQLLAQAYQTLSDPNLREAYDQNSGSGHYHDDTTTSKPSTSSSSDAAMTAEEIYQMFFAEQNINQQTDSHVDMSEMDWSTQSSELENMFDECFKTKFEELPDYPLPPQLQHMTLMDYQKDGIKWLVHQERQSTPPAWFQKRENRGWFCEITGCNLSYQPRPLRGGLLCDDMGLGKTLQTLAMILSNPPQGQSGYPYKRQSLGGALGGGAGRRRSAPSRATLILCPLSVISNWVLQIKKHINGGGRKNVLSVGTYHGSSREKMLEQVQSNCYDIVLTSYHTLAYDYKKYLIAMDEKMNVKKPAPASQSSSNLPSSKRQKTTKPQLHIFDLEFHRIVLDEGHIIRNSKSNFFKSVRMLNSRFKLVCTGTPFVNRPSDIHSLLSFLDAPPLGNKRVFEQRVIKPIKERREIGLTILRTTMAHVALRRTKVAVKDKINLVKKTVEIRTIAWPDDSWHNDVHSALYEAARSVFMSFLLGGKKGEHLLLNNYMAFIEVVLRVRQSCCSASLVPEKRREAALEILQMAKDNDGLLNPEEAEDLLDRLRATFTEEPELECPVCMEIVAQDSAVVLKTCKHIFCQTCLDQVPNQLCPLCRNPYTEDDCVQKSEAEKATKKNKSKGGKCKTGGERSPKLQALLDALEEMEPDEKGVIFSQWTSHLDIIQEALVLLGHTYTRIDGSMSPQERIDAMEMFDHERCDTMRTPRFILCSLHACGTGVNLTRANVVFMMDTWWNEAVEKQAMDRVHRLGQTRPVRCVRLVMGETLEHRMINLQDAKAALGKGSIERLKPDEKRLARLTALRDLFQVPEDLEREWAKW